MSGHKHDPSAGTQNQGNTVGDRPCVRQSKLYRVQESGNNIKSIMGSSNLCWDTNKVQGAYTGQKLYDHDSNRMLGGEMQNKTQEHLDPKYQAHELRRHVNAEYNNTQQDLDPRFQAHDLKNRVNASYNASNSDDYSEPQISKYKIPQDEKYERDAIDELCFPLNKMGEDKSSRQGKSSAISNAQKMRDTRPW